MASRQTSNENTSEDERELEIIKSELSDSAESDIISRHVDLQFISVSDRETRSAPTSPQSKIVKSSFVKYRVASFEHLANMPSTLQLALGPLRNSRATHKAWVRKKLDAVQTCKDGESLNRASFKRLEGG